MFVDPAPTMVTVLPNTVATAVLDELKIMGSPEAPPVADKAKAASPKVLAGKAANVMVCGLLFTVNN